MTSRELIRIPIFSLRRNRIFLAIVFYLRMYKLSLDWVFDNWLTQMGFASLIQILLDVETLCCNGCRCL